MKLLKFALLFFSCLLASICTVSAVDIGLSPATAGFHKMLRGGYASRYVTLSTSIPQPLTAHYTVYGEVKDWISLDVNGTTFVLSRDEPFRLKVMVTPPDDIQNGDYSGYIRIITDKLGDLEGGTGSVVRAAVSLQLKVEITGEEILACRAGAFSIPSVEVGYPLDVSYTVINDGNVKLKPRVEVDIWDQFRENLLYSDEFFEETVLQTEQERITKRVVLELPVGQYWANLNVVECGISQLLTFSVLEKGAIADDGDLLAVKTKPWVHVGEIVPITAMFRNNGDRSVFAVFRAGISYNDQIIHLIETSELEVAKYEYANFTEFFTPQYPGKFVVSGRVHYNKKITYEKGTVMNVMPEERPSPLLPRRLRPLPVIIYVGIMLTIIWLLIRIRRRRRLRRR